MNSHIITKAAISSAAMALLGISQAFAMGGNMATHGEALLKESCSKCHAVGAEGDSTVAGVKPFRDVIASMPADGIGATFLDSMSKKHGEFKFEPLDAKAIGDYLEKLKLHLEKK
jgi:cytochrome c